MYTIESLNTQINYLFHNQHGINEKDVEIVNKIVTALEKELKGSTIKPGVKVRCIGKKVTYENGHLEIHRDDGEYEICMHPSVYVGLSEDNKPWFLSSGGYYANAGEGKKIKYTGKTELKDFWTFGHNGACGHGGIRFQAEVAVFKYEDEQIY